MHMALGCRNLKKGTAEEGEVLTVQYSKTTTAMQEKIKFRHWEVGLKVNKNRQCTAPKIKSHKVLTIHSDMFCIR